MTRAAGGSHGPGPEPAAASALTGAGAGPVRAGFLGSHRQHQRAGVKGRQWLGRPKPRPGPSRPRPAPPRLLRLQASGLGISARPVASGPGSREPRPWPPGPRTPSPPGSPEAPPRPGRTRAPQRLFPKQAPPLPGQLLRQPRAEAERGAPGEQAPLQPPGGTVTGRPRSAPSLFPYPYGGILASLRAPLTWRCRVLKVRL